MRASRWNRAAVLVVALAVAVLAGPSLAGAQEEHPGGAVKAYADGNVERSFVPVNPCRLVDTRVAGGTMASLETRSFDVRGTGGTFASQGGKANGCDIPSWAGAVEISVTAVNATRNGYLRIYPGAEPQASFMNYTSHFNTSSTGTVAVCGFTGSLCLVNSDVTVKNYAGTTHVVIDVQGYYVGPISALVNSNATLSDGHRITAVRDAATGAYGIKSDRKLNKCTPLVSLLGLTASNLGTALVFPNIFDADEIMVYTFNDAGTAADKAFFITITC